MSVTHYHSDIGVKWTDKQWETFRAIKDDPEWRPNQRKEPLTMVKLRHSMMLNPLLVERAKVFAKSRDISFQGLIDTLLRIVAE